MTDLAPRTPLDDPRLTVMGLFAEAFTGVAAKLTAQLSQLGLAGAEFEALLRLTRSPNHRLRMTDLTYAVITPAGQQLIDSALPGHLELIEQWLLGPLGAEERRALEAALRCVRDAVQPDATAGADGGADWPVELPQPARATSAR